MEGLSFCCAAVRRRVSPSVDRTGAEAESEAGQTRGPTKLRGISSAALTTTSPPHHLTSAWVCHAAHHPPPPGPQAQSRSGTAQGAVIASPLRSSRVVPLHRRRRLSYDYAGSLCLLATSPLRLRRQPLPPRHLRLARLAALRGCHGLCRSREEGRASGARAEGVR